MTTYWLKIFVFVAFHKIASTCSSQCSCHKDIYGRREMKCNQSGIYDLSSLLKDDILKNSEVISIIPPQNYENYLAISPIFQSYKNLQELRILNSNVPAIEKQPFAQMGQLRILDLSFNKISRLSTFSFQGLVLLEALYLDNNKIDHFPHGIFQNVKNLKVLSLQHNLFKELSPRIFFGLNRLDTIDLSGNTLNKLDPDVFDDTKYLRYLRCRNCGLTRVNQTSIRFEGRNKVKRYLLFRILTDLEEVDFRDNKIERLETGQFHDLKRLRIVRLDGNMVGSIPERTFGNSDLILLGLSRNRIRELFLTSFQGCKVWQLDLSYNDMMFINNKTLIPLSSELKSLSLEGNTLSLDNIKSVLSPVKTIIELNLANMRLSCLDEDLLKGMQNLKLLNLSHNSLKEISAEFLMNLSNLKLLDVSFNKLRGISQALYKRFTNIAQVKMERNTWVCDVCHVSFLLKWIKYSHVYTTACVNPDNTSCLKCAAPYSLRGTPIQFLEKDDLAPCMEEIGEIGELSYSSQVRSVSLHFAITLLQVGTVLASVLTVLFIVAFAVICILYNRHAAHYYTHEGTEEVNNDVINNPAIKGSNIMTIDKAKPESQRKDMTLHFDGKNYQSKK